MKRKTDKNLEAIREYIENELSRNEITEERKRELKVINDYYFSELTGEKICTQYNISRRTLYKYRDRFNMMFSNKASYGNLKKGNNKLYDFQRNKLEDALSKSPFIENFKFLEWNEKILKEYIKEKFNLSYTNQQYKRIIENIKIDYKKQFDSICSGYDDIIYVDFFSVKTANISYEEEVIIRTKVKDIRKVCYIFLEYLKNKEYLKDEIKAENLLKSTIHTKAEEIIENSDIVVKVFSEYICVEDEKVKQKLEERLKKEIECINERKYTVITSKDKLDKKIELYVIIGINKKENILVESYSGRNFEDNIFEKFINKISNNKRVIVIVKEDQLGKNKLDELIKAKDKRNVKLLYIKNTNNSKYKYINRIKEILEYEFNDIKILSGRNYIKEIEGIVNMKKGY
ncbi:MAG: hypothetical protein ACLTA9_05165 [Clostridium saudiense]|uniref:Uncharacterized protein n=1 Tax=Clostridium disporicum TaxID=84024 RepID=A0A174HR07_9CLOT|nr:MULTISPECIES: hypothetical protein [Clostridium]MBS4959066.1 hypothetical protein [Clostridium sp.]MBX9184914.1 hypothetical protein [Clostridium sp. K04]MDU7453323.1 hypothetical protein [Clostridium saudiense]CUO22667.1 Uncharacterised protein [Clostridium disporicum]CUO77412.1 Uncharacterised protein [Clostridium disporicum]